MNDTSEINLPPKVGGGPFGLGDPDDKSLRKVETEVLIPKVLRDRTKNEKCQEAVEAFTECCKNSSIAMIVTCRKENAALKACLERWYSDENFKEECKQEYLNDRSEYRRTGIPQKVRTTVRMQSL